MRSRLTAVGALALGSAILALGCGAGSDRIDRAALRDCLGESGLRVEPPIPGAGTSLAGLSPDFTAFRGKLAMDVAVAKDAESARRKAADLRGSLQSYGVADPGGRLITGRNVIVFFEQDPNAAARSAIDRCLG